MHLENRIKDVRQVTHSVKTGIKLIGFILLLGLNFQGMGQHRSYGEPLRKGRISLKLTVRDSHNRNAVEYATLLLKKGKNRQFSGITDEKGSHTFLSIPKGDYELTVTSLGYKSRTIDLHARRDTTLTILLLSNDIAMQDVVVTAYESRGATSASRIDRKAMEHLQPSSFTDLVELLPGNVSKDPSMGSANLIKLREAGGTGPSDYDVTSFGTSFVIDGVPLNNDANMQYISNSWETGRNTTGKGIDMRSISTDDIAKVEIVRGIPSVEYGDLTSGLVNIERKKGGNDLEARFKADMQSQLFYVGKGIELTDKQFTLNTGIDYLDSKIDPRNNRENFKRVTGSIRAEKRWTNDHWRLAFNSNLNYRGTFENDKNDPDLTPSGAIDSYESSNNALSLAGTLSLNNRKKGFFRSLSLTASASGSWDNIHQEKTVVPSKLSVVPTATQPGVHDAEILPSTYLASLDVNGNPFNAFVKAIATFNYNYRNWFNIIKVGGDWRMNKNYGEGQLYDMRRPISIDITTRPRPFNDIPAEHNLAFFIEEASKDRQILFLMNNVEKRSVVFINEDNDLPTGLLANTADQSGETIIQSHFLTHFAIHLFISIQLNTQHLLQTFLIHMLRHAHVKVKHRIPSPFRLQLINGKSLKQFLTTFKIRMQCAGEQTLAKTARTTQKHILRIEMCHSINVFRLIYIQIVLSADFRESLYSYRIKLSLLFHIFQFTSKLSSISFT